MSYHPSLFLSTFRAFDEVARQSKYPPHDVIHVGDNKYQLVLAIAGFKKEDIDIDVIKSVLTVTGTKVNQTDENVRTWSYIYNGISHRSFKKQFALPETMKVISATFDAGLLTIDLEDVLPETQKIKIN